MSCSLFQKCPCCLLTTPGKTPDFRKGKMVENNGLYIPRRRFRGRVYAGRGGEPQCAGAQVSWQSTPCASAVQNASSASSFNVVPDQGLVAGTTKFYSWSGQQDVPHSRKTKPKGRKLWAKNLAVHPRKLHTRTQLSFVAPRKAFSILPFGFTWTTVLILAGGKQKLKRCGMCTGGLATGQDLGAHEHHLILA